MSGPEPLVNQSSAATVVEDPEVIVVMLPPMRHSDTRSIRLPEVINGVKMVDPNKAFYFEDPETPATITSRAWAQAARKCSANSKKYFSLTGEGFEAIAVRYLDPREATNLGDGRHGNKTISGDRQNYADAVYKHMYGVERTSDDPNDKDNARCSRCKEGEGPFKLYVTLDGISHGCSNCHYTGDNPRCTVNPNRNERQAPVVVEAEVIQSIRKTLEQVTDHLSEVDKSLRHIDRCHGLKRSFSDIN